MSAEKSSHEPTSNSEVVISRVFDAPRDLVFEMWTVPEHFSRWFGPRSAEMPSCTIDPRPGGVIHFCHAFPDGTKLWVKGAFDDVAAPERLVFTLGFVDAEGRPGRHPMVPDWPLDAKVEATVLLRETTGGTSVTLRQRLLPAEAAAIEAVAEERRLAREAWPEVFDRLAEQLATARSGKVPAT